MKTIIEYVENTQMPELPYREIRLGIEHHMINPMLRNWVSVHIEPGWFCIQHYTKTITFVGNKVFPKTMKVNEFCKTKTGRFYGRPDTITDEVLKDLHLEWALEVPGAFRNKKDVMSQILLGKHTNVESLFKAYIKKHYKGIFAWKDVRDYYDYYYSCVEISLYNIMIFTTNPAVALHKLVAKNSDMTSLKDTIRLAILLDEQVNPLWSESRLNEEHTRQNRLINKAKIDRANSKPIYPEEIVKLMEYKGLTLINTEKDCLDFALHMSNCLHTIHWEWLQHRERLAFRLVTNGEEACVEFIIHTDGTLALQEARGIRNSSLSTISNEHIAYILKGLNLKGVGKVICDYKQSIKPVPPVVPVFDPLNGGLAF